MNRKLFYCGMIVVLSLTFAYLTEVRAQRGMYGSGTVRLPPPTPPMQFKPWNQELKLQSDLTLPPPPPPPPPSLNKPLLPPMIVTEPEDEQDKYLRALRITDTIYNHGTGILTIWLSHSDLVANEVFRRKMEEAYKAMAEATARAIIQMQEEQKARALEAFYWASQEEKRRKQEEIIKDQNKIRQLEQEARDEARSRCIGAEVQRNREHSRINVSTGTAFRQLKSISISGWGR